MSCTCLNSLAAALAALLGLEPITLSLPLDLPKLTLAAGNLGTLSAMASASMSASLSAALGLGLPALALNMSAMAKLSATAAAALAASTTLGLNLSASASASASLSLQMSSLAANLAALLAALAGINIPQIMALGRLSAMIMAFKVGLGINLLAPGVGLKLSASLSAALALAASLGLGAGSAKLAILAQFAAVANLAAALGVNLGAPGAMASLSAALKLAASLQLPAIALPGMSLAKLIGLLMALANIQGAFGINLLMPNAMMQLKLALGGLTLPSLVMSAKLSEAIKLGGMLAAVMPALSANLSAIASLNMSAVMKLALGLPNLGPLSLVASLVASAKLGAGINLLVPPGSCSGSCPIGGKH
jgi:hypothetical protein